VLNDVLSGFIEMTG